MKSKDVLNLFVHVDEHLVETDVDDHDEVNFHLSYDIFSQLYFSMFVNLLDAEYYDVVMNSTKLKIYIYFKRGFFVLLFLHQIDQRI
jgi:hypothetical protein